MSDRRLNRRSQRRRTVTKMGAPVLCACGCGAVPRSMWNYGSGRPVRYVWGHYPKVAHPRKGVPVTPETRAKIGAVKRGKKHSDETRAKISAAQRTRAKMTATRPLIHHIDGNHSNNDPSNRWVFPNQREHMRYHNWVRMTGVLLGVLSLKSWFLTLRDREAWR